MRCFVARSQISEDVAQIEACRVRWTCHSGAMHRLLPNFDCAHALVERGVVDEPNLQEAYVALVH